MGGVSVKSVGLINPLGFMEYSEGDQLSCYTLQVCSALHILTMSHSHVTRMFYGTSLNRLTVWAHGCVAKTAPWE